MKILQIIFIIIAESVCKHVCVCVCMSVCAGGFSLPLFIVFPHSDIVQFIYIVRTVECTRSVADNGKS